MWEDGIMPRTKGGDFATIARNVVEKAIGERLNGSPLPVEPPKNQAAVELSKLGASKGGRTRADKLSAAKRKAIAKKAARARWR